ncbi:hypothetical protein I4U23_013217 [Adineta vaga]|nr:hypothetical protein I4U23_013217 [Adineta vaga]
MAEKAIIHRSNGAVREELSLFNKLSEKTSTNDLRKDQYKNLVSKFYNLATDFFEYGWGQSFHFANRYQCETLVESIQRHESYLALKMQAKPGDQILDMGCGVGGPLRRIAYLTNAHITGISICEYQIQRAKTIGIPTNCSFIHGDFMKLPFEDNTFDHVYVIEAVCHSPNKAQCCAEVFRVLKPGGSFVGYDCCLTDKYDLRNSQHMELKRLTEDASALPELQSTKQLVHDLQSVGFIVEESKDLPPADIPWYQPLKGADSFLSIGNFRTTVLGRWLTRNMVWLMEKSWLAAEGSLATLNILENTAHVMIQAGESGIFTPYFFFLARKVK